MANLNVEIISIEGILFKGVANQVVAPVSSGEIGFMADHESVVAELKEGTIKIFNEKDELIKEFEAKRGVTQMHQGEKLVILLES